VVPAVVFGIRLPRALTAAFIDNALKASEAVAGLSAAMRGLRILLGDDVGLGKTLEAGLLASELILRRRARGRHPERIDAPRGELSGGPIHSAQGRGHDAARANRPRHLLPVQG
jgi:hypothetical protein